MPTPEAPALPHATNIKQRKGCRMRRYEGLCHDKEGQNVHTLLAETCVEPCHIESVP